MKKEDLKRLKKFEIKNNSILFFKYFLSPNKINKLKNKKINLKHHEI